MEGKANHLLAYEEFEPLCKWQRKEDRDILEIHVPGFNKEQLKVQISNHGVLKISGERQLNVSTKSKFYKEYQMSSKYDTPTIHAKFVNGWLYITMPKRKTLVPEKEEKWTVGSSIDRTPEPKSKAPIPNDSSILGKEKTQTNVENGKMCEFQGHKPATSSCIRLAKVAVSLTATATVMVALVAYVVYMYKSTMVEVDDFIN